MVDRTIINAMEQMRDFDFVQDSKDGMLGINRLAADVLSQLASTVVAGFAATQTNTPSLTINIGAGRIYTQAPIDALAAGSIAQDLTNTVQQGANTGQTLTLIAPAPGQSQWNLIQCQFSQIDSVRAGDPNAGIVPFYNVADATQPNSQSINTVRRGVAVLQVVSGAAATTGSEIPPQPSVGWVPLYLIDLAGGQTAIATSQILLTGPSVGTGVPTNYPRAPFVAGLLAQHHTGFPGQAPQINLRTEVQGVLPYVNMSPVRTLLTSGLTLFVNPATGADTNTGLTPSVPFKTIQAAVNSVYRNWDFNGFGCTVSLANGNYVITSGPSTFAAFFQGQPIGLNGAIQLVGNVTTPGNVLVGVTNGNGLAASAGAIVNISGITVTTTGTNIGIVTTSGYGITSSTGAVVTVSSCVIGSCGSVQVQASLGGTVIVNNLQLTGATQYALLATLNGVLWAVGAAITVTGLSTTNAFANATQNGTFTTAGNTFIGSATGPRYFANNNGTITTNSSGNANYFPGSVAGSVGAGGQYS